MTIAKRLEEMGREQGMLQGMKQGLEQGLEQGLSKGHQEGEREASLKIARNMLAKSFDRAAVMEVTGLSPDDLHHIKH